MQMYKRKNRCFLKVSGADAHKFLNNILTQNLSLLKNEPNKTCLSCLLNQKGGLIAYFWLSLINEEYCLDMDASMLNDAHSFLQKYKLRMKVDFEVLDGLGSYFHQEKASMIPSNQQVSLTVNNKKLYRSIVNQENISDLDIKLWSHADWDLYRIETLWPKWQQDVMPGMLVLQSDFLRQGIAFDKGCYLGQETVARVDSRGGKVAYKLKRVKAPLGSLNLGENLHNVGEEKSVGALSSVAQNTHMQEDWALALIHRNAHNQKILITNKGTEVELQQ